MLGGFFGAEGLQKLYISTPAQAGKAWTQFKFLQRSATLLPF